MLSIPPPGVSRSRGRLFPITDIQLSVGVLSAGIENRYRERYRHHGLHRGNLEFLLFQYTLEGAGLLRFEKEQYTLEPGQAMLLLVPHDHCYWLPKSGHWCFHYLCLGGGEALRLGRELQKKWGPVLNLESRAPAVLSAAELCNSMLCEPELSKWEHSHRAYEFLLKLCQAAESPNNPETTSPDPETPAAIRRAFSYLQTHYHEPIDVEVLASEAGLSRYHFSRLFRQAVGFPPGTYLRRLRLNHALQLLQKTHLSIEEVARQSGFSDPNYFSRRFRETYEVSPRQFRKLF